MINFMILINDKFNDPGKWLVNDGLAMLKRQDKNIESVKYAACRFALAKSR
jgi:hypothetical protein